MAVRAPADIYTIPGFRRFIRIEPGLGGRPGVVRAMLEDDVHAMAVELHHENGVVTCVKGFMDRAPWSTCPGAEREISQSFTGLPLDQVTVRHKRTSNCTHLHDLAVFAASRAYDVGPTVFALAASDFQGGERVLEIRKDGVTIHRWVECDGLLIEPSELSGQTLHTLRDWIATLPEPAKEAARMLQWASMIAHGRYLSDEVKHAALFRGPICFSMQPGRVERAQVLSPVADLSSKTHHPLEDVAMRFEARL